MHVGNFRTALYTYIFAKQNRGDFILRIEDTDQKRYVAGGIANIILTLKTFNFVWDEGVEWKNFPLSKKDGEIEIVNFGNFGPYIQSERLDIYKKYAKQLVESGHAYYCFCSSERLEEMRNEQSVKKQAPMYDRTCLKLPKEEIEKKINAGEKYVIRQKINTEGFTEYEDLIRGKVKIQNNLLDDQILMKSDGYPTYNFANVVDDNLMQISHILRGEEYISSTPKYIQLYQNFGWDIPLFVHLPLLLNPDKTKLSKRQGDVAVEDYIQRGYLKEAIINFVALLGWNPGEGETQEIFSMEELIEKFDLKKVHKAGAVFDLKKLDWLNAQYIKKLSIDELYKLSLDFWKQKDFYTSWNIKHGTWNTKDKENYLKKVLIIEQERLENLSAVGESNKFFFQDIEYDKALLKWKDMSDLEVKNSLAKSKGVLENISDSGWTKENLEKFLLEAAGDKRGELLWPLRSALTGEQKSPSPFEVAWVLGKEESLKRIEKAIEKL